MPLDKYPEGHGRAVSSPSTHSESYGRFASKSFHLYTFPIRIWIKQFSSPAMLPQSSGAGHQAGQANLTDIRLVHFYVCRMDVLGCRRAGQSGKAVKLERRSVWHISMCAEWTFWDAAEQGSQARQASLKEVRLAHFCVCRMDVMGCPRRAGKLARRPFDAFRHISVRAEWTFWDAPKTSVCTD